MSTNQHHIVHFIYRLDTGGMENGLVNLVNRLPDSRYRHTIVSLTGVGPIAQRIQASNVEVIALERRPGPLLRDLPRIWRLLRRLRPAIVHTRNIGTLEVQLAAFLAGVPVRVHGEHGWEVHDLGAGNQALLAVRRRMRRFVHRQVALSEATARYLREKVGVPTDDVQSILNGVDTRRFAPSPPASPASATAGQLAAEVTDSTPSPAWPADAVVIGYVGRLADVKNPALLLEAFAGLATAASGVDVRLVFIGDGPLRAALETRVAELGLSAQVWFAGDRSDVPRWMQTIDIHALPSLAEGICNTLLEAMATAIPSVATDVGGNPELVDDGRSGTLVPSSDPDAMGAALARYVSDPALRRAHGEAARRRAVEHFGIDSMVRAYDDLYCGLLSARGLYREPALEPR